jgi:hypothetical protein
MILAGALFCLSALSAIGLGSLVARLFGISPNTGERGFLGLFGFGIVGIAVHFFFPVSSAVQYTVLALGFTGLAVCRRDLGGIRSAACSAIAFACVFFHSRPGPFHDNGLYHMPTILWNTQSPVVMGIVGLHGRLAFNSLFFMIEAFVDRLTIGFIGNSLAAAFLLLAAFEHLLATPKKSAAAGEFWFLTTAIVAFVSSATLTGWLGITDADHFTAVLVTYWVFLLLQYGRGARLETVSSLMLLIAAFAAMTKLSAAPVLGVTLVLFAFRRGAFPSRKAVVVIASCLTIWCLRGFLQSGCLLYPVPQTCVSSVPWVADKEHVEAESVGARAYARVPGIDDYAKAFRDWTWFRPWLANIRLQRLSTEWIWAVALGLAGLVYRIFLRIYGVEAGEFDLSIGLAAVASLLGIAYWFWAAPDPRFGLGFLGSFAIVMVSFTLASLLPEAQIRAFVAPLVLTGAACWTLYSASDKEWVKLPAIPRIAVVPRAAPGGQRVWVPSKGDQCWDNPIPCTPASQFVPDWLAKVRWRPFTSPMPPKALMPLKQPFSLPIRVDAGADDAYTDTEGRVWLPDAGYLNGSGFQTDAVISGTRDPKLYATERFVENGSLLYELSVPNGNYTVVLRFAEYAASGLGERVFDVLLNGKVVYPGLDLFSVTGGINRAFDLTRHVTVTAGVVEIKLTTVTSKPVLSAFEILPES